MQSVRSGVGYRLSHSAMDHPFAGTRQTEDASSRERSWLFSACDVRWLLGELAYSLLRTDIEAGMVAFDVGANLGYYTLLFSDRVG